MSALGTFDYPDTTVEDAVELSKKLAGTFKATEFGRDALAAALGYKAANSGAFNQKLADLRKFGIVEGRGDSSRTTELARTIAAPAPGEYQNAVASLMFRVPLYKALYDHYKGATPGEEDFFATLLNITKADRMDVQKQAAKIRSLYLAGSSMIGNKPVSPPPPAVGEKGFGGAPMQQMQMQPPKFEAPLPPGREVRSYTSPDGLTRVMVPNTKDDMEELKEMLELWLKRAPSKQVPPVQIHGAKPTGDKAESLI